MNYIIISAADTATLETLVNAEYLNKYQAWGGIVYDGTNYHQAMVLKYNL